MIALNMPLPTRRATPVSGNNCRIYDGDVRSCDATANCAYYYCSESCWTRGTPNAIACTTGQNTPSQHPYDFPSFFWGAALGGALVFAGVAAAVLTKFLFSHHPTKKRGTRAIGFGTWWLNETARAIHGKTTPRYDAVVMGAAMVAFLFSLVDLLDLLLAFLLGKPIDVSAQATFFSFRLPIVMVTPLVFMRLFKFYNRSVAEGQKLKPAAAQALRVYLVVTIAVTTSLLCLFGAKLFYLFLLWGFETPNFDPLNTTRPFSYVFVTLPIAATHFVLFRWLRKHPAK